ncbi:MAG: GlsB/YeaQ/YmgE family stress response membrane protein [Anaerolineae bacterium]|nr:GlsB/YeaQ/YmgE family stress response membrane protein [Anaerolineae bacterium]
MDIGAAISALVASPFICLGWIIVGAIAGAAARQIMRDANRPFVEDVILGLIGAVVGGFIFNVLGIGRPEGGIGAVIISLVVATVGGIVLIWLVRLIRGRK